jgi:type I site-specific restriction endonuclease
MPTEADTCRKFVVPKLQAAGWDSDPHSIAEQRSFTDGRIVVRGSRAERKKTKRADYLLRYTRDFPIAVTEAKAEYKKAADGLQQAKEYAGILGLKFAYAIRLRADVTDGELQFTLPDVLKVPPISQHGNVTEIIGKFGGADQLRNAVNQLQLLLYAA